MSGSDRAIFNKLIQGGAEGLTSEQMSSPSFNQKLRVHSPSEQRLTAGRPAGGPSDTEKGQPVNSGTAPSAGVGRGPEAELGVGLRRVRVVSDEFCKAPVHFGSRPPEQKQQRTILRTSFCKLWESH